MRKQTIALMLALALPACALAATHAPDIAAIEQNARATLTELFGAPPDLVNTGLNANAVLVPSRYNTEEHRREYDNQTENPQQEMFYCGFRDEQDNTYAVYTEIETGTLWEASVYGGKAECQNHAAPGAFSTEEIIGIAKAYCEGMMHKESTDWHVCENEWETKWGEAREVFGMCGNYYVRMFVNVEHGTVQSVEYVLNHPEVVELIPAEDEMPVNG